MFAAIAYQRRLFGGYIAALFTNQKQQTDRVHVFSCGFGQLIRPRVKQNRFKRTQTKHLQVQHSFKKCTVFQVSFVNALYTYVHKVALI